MKRTITRLHLLTLVTLPLLLGNDDNYTPPIHYSHNLSQNELASAKKALRVFYEACQPLMGKYAKDIESINVSGGFNKITNSHNNQCLDYRCEDYGWDKQIYIKVKIKQHTTTIPDHFRANGHNLHFYLGGPNRPGITTAKRPQLCGVEKINPGKDIFISVPKLKYIFIQ